MGLARGAGERAEDWQPRTLSAKLRNVDFVPGAGGHQSLLKVVKPDRQGWRVVVERLEKPSANSGAGGCLPWSEGAPDGV